MALMDVLTNISLADYSTMRLGGTARALATVTSKEQLLEALEWTKKHRVNFLVLGGGSNVIFSDGFDGLIILNRIPGFEVTETDNGVLIKIGAGENWDETVRRTVSLGLTGIEALSLVPGTAGATPVQNVGAYGQEIADAFVQLEAYDLGAGQFVTLNKEACGFRYRNSIFKDTSNRRYIITSITLRLQKANPKPPFYAALQRYLDEHHITEFTPQAIRDAVIAIRTKKLPDPAKLPNTGSFFKNPIVDTEQFSQLAKNYPDIPHWDTKDGRIKLSAGWLIEHAGLKGYAAHGMKTYEHNALVAINEHASSYAQLKKFKDEIATKVQERFGVQLEQEPELI